MANSEQEKYYERKNKQYEAEKKRRELERYKAKQADKKANSPYWSNK